MKQGSFEVCSNENIAKDIYKMVLKGDTSHITASGQFINIKLNIINTFIIFIFTNHIKIFFYRFVKLHIHHLAIFHQFSEDLSHHLVCLFNVQKNALCLLLNIDLDLLFRHSV